MRVVAVLTDVSTIGVGNFDQSALTVVMQGLAGFIENEIAIVVIFEFEISFG